MRQPLFDILVQRVVVHKDAHPRAHAWRVQRLQMNVLHGHDVDPCLVGRHEELVRRARGEERTRVCADAQQADRGLDRGEVERGDVGERGYRGIVRGWRNVPVGAAASKRKELERAAAASRRDKERTAVDKRKIPCT